METKCYVCGEFLEEEDICQTCLEFLQQKYPNKKKLKQILQWHKNQTKELNKED
ncbi:hypothetical protein HOA55_02035 [archaeon]|nr:hypothetical protein [archaeon]MBT7025392.1 hypothetical protein [archaeon]MBT7568163.1 hypothetical protein [archaeon]